MKENETAENRTKLNRFKFCCCCWCPILDTKNPTCSAELTWTQKPGGLMGRAESTWCQHGATSGFGCCPPRTSPPAENQTKRSPRLQLSEHSTQPCYVTTSAHRENILEPSPHWLTNTDWFLSRPLATLLAGNCFLSLQLKGRLALKLQTVPVAERGSFSSAVGRDPRITTAPLVDLWKKIKQILLGAGSDTELAWCCRPAALAEPSQPQESACAPSARGAAAVPGELGPDITRISVLWLWKAAPPNSLCQLLPHPWGNHSLVKKRDSQGDPILHLLQGCGWKQTHHCVT